MQVREQSEGSSGMSQERGRNAPSGTLILGTDDRIITAVGPNEVAIETSELAINLKTAKALGLTIPPSLLLRADQVIE